MAKIPDNIGKQILDFFSEIYSQYINEGDKNMNNYFINNFQEKYDLKILQKEFKNVIFLNINLYRQYEELEQLINEKLNNNEIIEIKRLINLYRDCIFIIKSIEKYFEDKDTLELFESTQLKEIKINDNKFEFMISKISKTIYIINLNNIEFHCKNKFNLSENNENEIIEQYIEDFKKKYLKFEILKKPLLNNNVINNKEHYIDFDIENYSSASTVYSEYQNEINDYELIENENKNFLYYNLNNKDIIPSILKNIKNIGKNYDNNKIINGIYEYKGNLILYLGSYFYRYHIKKGFFSKLFNVESFYLIIENKMTVFYLVYSFPLKKQTVNTIFHKNISEIT